MSNTTERIKSALSNYGHMLKNAYIPSHRKKKIRTTMKSLERELARLEKVEKIANIQNKIAKTRANINKLNSQSKGPSAYSRFEKIIMSGSPDYWGQMGGGGNRSRGRGRKRSGGMLDLDFNI